jgi:hypothetical protein
MDLLGRPGAFLALSPADDATKVPVTARNCISQNFGNMITFFVLPIGAGRLRRRESQMKSQEPQRDDEKGRVLLFRPRIPRARNDNLRRPDPFRSPVADLSKYEQPRDEESYRQRMVNNLLAFALLSLIVYCGIWLANTMAQLRTNQDCVLTGRTNCAPIKVPIQQH